MVKRVSHFPALLILDFLFENLMNSSDCQTGCPKYYAVLEILDNVAVLCMMPLLLLEVVSHWDQDLRLLVGWASMVCPTYHPSAV